MSTPEKKLWSDGIRTRVMNSLAKKDGKVASHLEGMPEARFKELDLEQAATIAAVITDNPTLLELSIKGDSIPLGQLRSPPPDLDLSHKNFLAAEAVIIAAFFKAKGTSRSVNLSDNKLGPKGITAIAEALVGNTTLTSLNLETCKSDERGEEKGDPGAIALATMLKGNSSLLHLNISFTNIADAGANALADALKANSTLKSLEVRGNNIGDAAARALAAAVLEHKSLEMFDGIPLGGGLRTRHFYNAVNTGVGPVTMLVLKPLLQANTTVTTMDLSKNALGDTGVAALAEALKTNTAVTVVDISKNGFGDPGTIALAECLKVNAHVTSLDITFNAIKDQGATALAGALAVNGALQTLKLRQNQIGDPGFQALGKNLEDNKSLTNLDLAHNKMGPDGAASLGAMLQKNRHLHTLEMSYNKIGTGASKLAHGIEENKHLASLLLKGNAIADSAIDILNALGKNRSLTTLDLGSNALTVKSAAALRGVLKGSSITNLDVGYNPIGDEGILAIAEGLQTGNTIRVLNLAKTNFGPKGANALADALQHSSTLESMQLDQNTLAEGAEALGQGIEMQLFDKHRALLVARERGMTEKFFLRKVTALIVDAKFGARIAEASQPFKDLTALLKFAISVAARDSKLLRKMLEDGKDGGLLGQLMTHVPSDPEELPLPHLLVAKGDSFPDAMSPSSHSARGEFEQLLGDLAWKYPEAFRIPNNRGFNAVEESQKMKTILNSKLQFCQQFEPTTFLPEHRSATCVVFRAKDVKNQRREVVLKLMKIPEQFRREIEERKGLDGEFVLALTCDSDSFPTRWAADAHRLYKCGGYSWGVVMPAAQRNLMVVILQERLGLGEIKALFLALARCLEHMHFMERIHGDVKPLNVVRMPNGKWKLIDLDATVPFGTPAGVKSSTAYCPPEFGSAPLPAHPSFDIWGLGCVLVRALAHRPLLEADDRDNLRGRREKIYLSQWDFKKLALLLDEVSAVLRDDGASHYDRLVSCDILGWLLQPQPKLRPSATQIQDHAFVHTGGPTFMSPVHMLACEPATKENVEKIKSLLTTEDHHQHPLGKTPLHMAAEEGNFHMMTVILAHPKTVVDARDFVGHTPLQSVLHILNRDDLATEQLFPVCRDLCKQSNLDLVDGSTPPTATLDLGRKSPNDKIRELFERDMVEVQIFGALAARPPRLFSDDDFNRLWISRGEELQKSLFEAVMEMLRDWGFNRMSGGSEEKKETECRNKGNYVRNLALKLLIWQTPAYFKALQDLANERLNLVHQDMYKIRDGLQVDDDGKFMVQELKGFGQGVLIPIPSSEIVKACPNTPRLLSFVDEQVFVPLIRGVAQEMEDFFRDKLQECLAGAIIVKNKRDLSSLREDWDRWVTVAPIKGAPRMSAKVREYREEAERKGEEHAQKAWPHISCIGDTLRAMVVCRSANAIVRTWNDLNEAFQIQSHGRLKNNFNSAGRDGVTEKPPDMLINAVLRVGNTMPMTVEVQIHHCDILHLKELESHLLYEVTRASPKDFEVQPPLQRAKTT